MSTRILFALLVLSALTVTESQAIAPCAMLVEQRQESIDMQEGSDRSFAKSLSWKKGTMEVYTLGKGSFRKLALVSTVGSKRDSISREIDGSVPDAEIADLNCDGEPEIIIYTQSPGSGSYGKVLCFTIREDIQFREIMFPGLDASNVPTVGYMGHDEFPTKRRCIIRKFPLYGENDPNSSPAAGYRMVKYKLTQGPSMQFQVKQIRDFSNRKNRQPY